jgi:hypothetical protein
MSAEIDSVSQLGQHLSCFTPTAQATKSQVDHDDIHNGKFLRFQTVVRVALDIESTVSH